MSTENLLSDLSRRKFIVTAGATALGAILLKGCGTSNPSSTDQSQSSTTTQVANTTTPQATTTNDEATLYEAAKKEGKVVYYMGFLTQEILDEVGAAFSTKYPGIEFQGVRKTAGAIFQQLTQEMQANIKNADVFGTADIGQVIQLKNESKLMQYEPAGKESLLAQYRNIDAENFYQAGALLPTVIGYNTQKIQESEIPKSWKEVLNPKYKDQISVGSALASGQVGIWSLAIDQQYGWDKFFPQLNQLNPKLGRSINDVTADLISGERAIGIGSLGQFLAEKAKGNPIGIVYPEDGTLVVIGPVSILKDSPHPNAAKLFMNFLLSKEYSELVSKYFEQPLRTDVKIAGSQSLGEIKTLAPTAEEISKGLPQVKTRWKELFNA